MRGWVVAGLVLLAGCETGVSRQVVLQSLVGRPEADAMRTLGAPDRTFQANGRTFLAYDEERLSYAPVPPVYSPLGPFGYGYFGPATVPMVRACATTLEVASGRVVSWTLRGNAC